MYQIDENLSKFRLEACRRKLKSRYPEFGYPLERLEFKSRQHACPWKNEDLSTDGLHVYYSPKKVTDARDFELEEQLMHIVLHGMLGHFIRKDEFMQKLPRNQIMDAQVSYVMNEMGLGGEELDEAIYEASKIFKGNFGLNQYYRLQAETMACSSVRRVEKHIRKDNHEDWDNNDDTHRQKVNAFWEEARAGFFVKDENTDKSGSREEGEPGEQGDKLGLSMGEGIGDEQWLVWAGKDSWQKGKKRGAKAGETGQNITVQKKQALNYRDLLENLLSVREIAKELPDSLDPMLYHYGLCMYGDVPLVEPVEYNEERTLGVLVIAVDVSGSCADETIMNRFWNETFSCISEFGEETAYGEILLLQCDTVIQKEEWILLSEEFERPECVEAIGFGGTDFVPVFERIAELEKKVDALIYLSDGDGQYPEQVPGYPVYFVMPKGWYEHFDKNEGVPYWITKVCLEDCDGE